METDEVGRARTVPTHTELERALSSVPGVDEVKVTLNPESGRSRLRLRLARGEDAPTVSWAVSETLRERFGIDLAPEAIRPRIAEADDPSTADTGPRLVVAKEPAAEDEHDSSSDDPDLDATADPNEFVNAPDDDGVERGGEDLSPERGDDPSPERGTDDPSEARVVVTGDRDLLVEAASAIFRDMSDQPAPSIQGDRPGIERARDATEESRSHAVPADTGQSWDGYTAHRVLIRDLDTRIDLSDVRVTATLAFHDRVVSGVASAVPTRQGILRAVAEATVEAVCQLTQTRLTVGVDAVSASVSADPPIATVVVGVVTPGGEQPLLGASLVRNDPERAVMRATLDALNRRIAPWLAVELAG